MKGHELGRAFGSALLRRFVRLAVGLAIMAGTAAGAWAHGEKAQMPFLRMRAIQWYDVAWSKSEVKVGETLEITGKFHVSKHWPDAIGAPDVSFLNVGQPGPVFVRKATFVNGTFVPRSFPLEIGKDYEFKIVLMARRPGDWHVHPVMSVQGGGPLSGPGEWVKVTGDYASFTNPVKTIDGKTVDLETLGLASIYGWHLFWVVVSVAWIGYWYRRGGFVSRYLRVERSSSTQSADQMISPLDEKVTFGVLAATLLIVLVAYKRTENELPRTLPLQAGILTLAPSDPALSPSEDVQIRFQRALYDVPGRRLNVTIQVTNNSDEAVQIGELNTASVRFLNPKVVKEPVTYPQYLLAPQGLTLSDDKPIMPGETRTLSFDAQDAAWDTERLADIYYGTDSSIAGLLILYGERGTRRVIEIGGPAVPNYTKL